VFFTAQFLKGGKSIPQKKQTPPFVRESRVGMKSKRVLFFVYNELPAEFYEILTVAFFALVYYVDGLLPNANQQTEINYLKAVSFALLFIVHLPINFLNNLFTQRQSFKDIIWIGAHRNA
jgi:hypothetical protein